MYDLNNFVLGQLVSTTELVTNYLQGAISFENLKNFGKFPFR